MSLTEFQLINTFFKNKTKLRSDVLLGIGDDAAVMQVPDNYHLVFTSDTLVQGVHFDDAISPTDLGYKSLAVNLSDLAAMGATPTWFGLNLTLPNVDDNWLLAFAEGMFSLANNYHMQLIGGDTTGGPLTISIQAFGFVQDDNQLKRSGANVGDLIYVSGDLGDAAAALTCSDKRLKQHLFRPQPRVELGLQLTDIATSCIDISDGFAADLSHILDASHVGAALDLDDIPMSQALRECTKEQALNFALTGGDDYELCFTIPKQHQFILEERAKRLNNKITCIGVIQSQAGLFDAKTQKKIQLQRLGWQHF